MSINVAYRHIFWCINCMYTKLQICSKIWLTGTHLSIYSILPPVPLLTTKQSTKQMNTNGYPMDQFDKHDSNTEKAKQQTLPGRKGIRSPVSLATVYHTNSSGKKNREKMYDKLTNPKKRTCHQVHEGSMMQHCKGSSLRCDVSSTLCLIPGNVTSFFEDFGHKCLNRTVLLPWLTKSWQAGLAHKLGTTQHQHSWLSTVFQHLAVVGPDPGMLIWHFDTPQSAGRHHPLRQPWLKWSCDSFCLCDRTSKLGKLLQVESKSPPFRHLVTRSPSCSSQVCAIKGQVRQEVLWPYISSCSKI